MSVYTEQVAGFYDPDSTALFVLDDQPQDALAGRRVDPRDVHLITTHASTASTRTAPATIQPPNGACGPGFSVTVTVR